MVVFVAGACRPPQNEATAVPGAGAGAGSGAETETETETETEIETEIETETESGSESERDGAPCGSRDAVADRDACLAEVLPPGDWVRVSDPAPPFGYVCVLFGLGEPKCGGDAVRVVSRHQPATASAQCPAELSLYWAPMQNPTAAGRDLANGEPGEILAPVILDSDGVRFSYLRVDDFIVEGRICLDERERIPDALVGWAERLQPELYPPDAP